MKRFIHIWDLPAEKIYIQFNDKFRKKFFDCAYEKFGNWKLLGKNIGIKTSGVKTERGMNYLKLCDGKNITLFYQKINFKHPTKKIKLENLINKGWKFERFHNGVARERIIELLNLDNNLNANELASILDRNPQTIKGHLRNIKND